MTTGSFPPPVGEGSMPSDSPVALHSESSSRALEDRYRSHLSMATDAVARFATTRPIPIHLSVADQVAAFEHQAVLVECNEPMARLHNATSPSELVGSRLRDVFITQRERHRAFLTAFVQCGYRLEGVESEDLSSSGRPRRYLSSMHGVIEQGALVGAWGSRSDMSDGARRKPDGYRPESGSSAARLIEGLARATGTLLIVEDEPTVRLLMKRILEGRGYFVLAARSGEEALELSRSFGGVIDGLVADVILSGMTGTELARRLRSGHPDLRVLLVSGYSAEALRDYKVLDETMSFLPKPFTPDTLLERVAEVLTAGRG